MEQFRFLQARGEAPGAAPSPRGRLAGAARTLSPGYFALVMASGIVSIAMRDQALNALSAALLWVTGISYAVLVALTVWRLLAFRAELRQDLASPARGFGFFTFVAGTDVLGTRLVLGGDRTAGLALLAVGGVAWLLLGYAVPWAVFLSEPTRLSVAAADGTWFIWVVASQSVAVLAAALEPGTGAGRRELALLAVFSWSVGVFLYAAVGVFVTARLFFHDLSPADLSPPYWVAMGATAITVVAGARIVQMADAPMVTAARGLVAGVSILFWAFGTWLIPALLAAGWWRHVVRRVPLRYEPGWWSIVFPLGMYAVAGHFLGQADRLPIISAIGGAETWSALAAWAAVFVAMVTHLSRSLLPRR